MVWFAEPEKGRQMFEAKSARLAELLEAIYLEPTRDVREVTQLRVLT